MFSVGDKVCVVNYPWSDPVWDLDEQSENPNGKTGIITIIDSFYFVNIDGEEWLFEANEIEKVE